MRAGARWMVGAALGLTLVVGARVSGHGPEQAPQPAPQPAPTEGHGGPPPPGAQQPPAPAAPQGAQGRAARFPAQQRPPADPAVVERGRGVYVGSCGACHGIDARGGQLGGPNLLRSQLVLNDKDGELIGPLVKNGRPGTLMVPMAIPDPDIQAIAAYLHHLQSLGSNQGGPPPGPPVELDILVGNAQAGERFFTAQCSTCHSATGDLRGIATRVPEPKALQNLWVSGGRASRGRAGPPSPDSLPTATITWPSGEKASGQLVRLDDFLVTVAQPDGTRRTIRRTGEVPSVVVTDPLEGHRDLLGVLTDTTMHDVTAYLVTLK